LRSIFGAAVDFPTASHPCITSVRTGALNNGFARKISTLTTLGRRECTTSITSNDAAQSTFGVDASHYTQKKHAVLFK
jgi:hypothetical protein